MEDGLGRRTVRAMSCGGRSGTEDVQGYKLWRTVWDGGRSGL